MPTSPNMTQTSMSDAVKTMYERRLLVRAVPRLIHGRFGKKATINKYGSLEWRRYESVSAVTSALTEGETPTEETQPSITTVTATPEWYGAWIGYSDELDATAYDPIVAEVSGVLGEQAGTSVDTLIRNDVTAGATKIYSGGQTARANLDAPAHNVAYSDFLYGLSKLMANNALPLMNNRFAVIIHPDTWATLYQDPTFVNLFTEDIDPMRSGYMGTILMCDVFVTSNAREYASGGVGSTDVYSMLFIGRESFGVVGVGNTTPRDVDMAGVEGKPLTGAGTKASPVKIIVKPLGSAGAADPLNQRGTIGWKASLDTKILNSAFIVDLEHTTVRSDD